ncbi:MAG TPA: hypothetical protein VFR15_04375 [Chloroflexia bacterium]|nr:hypothetical protein [Chloroflexia bacterium]
MQPSQTGPQGAPTVPTGQPDPRELRDQRRIERHNENQLAGIPVWGVILILVGAIALLGNFNIEVGWIFGVALGAWFVYLGVRHMQAGQPVNWWLVGLGLLIGLGAVASGWAFTDDIVFPIVLVVVGLGILAEHYWSRQRQPM